MGVKNDVTEEQKQHYRSHRHPRHHRRLPPRAFKASSRSASNACFSRAAAQDRPCHPASFPTSRTPAHHRHHRHPRHRRRFPPRAFPSCRRPRGLRYPRLSHVRWPRLSASQPLLLRHHVPLHRRHCLTAWHQGPRRPGPRRPAPPTPAPSSLPFRHHKPLHHPAPRARRVPQTPSHRLFLPWQYFYNRALACPTPPTLLRSPPLSRASVVCVYPPVHVLPRRTLLPSPSRTYHAKTCPKGLASFRKALHSPPSVRVCARVCQVCGLRRALPLPPI